ncbi:hypothetical protein INS49_003950 [Diaporthe citri]|uniref:uncharacterized protein n=1 Tax=Diaporthe citri TaxID=83186 RepID=UPI001C817092|nr:uncharacterized protein INS49_003950 [Diaporthe citri]KAG6354869.1 hypothetical protein INS49_003950 [Diaporthe citri]
MAQPALEPYYISAEIYLFDLFEGPVSEHVGEVPDCAFLSLDSTINPLGCPSTDSSDIFKPHSARLPTSSPDPDPDTGGIEGDSLILAWKTSRQTARGLIRQRLALPTLMDGSYLILRTYCGQ